MAKASKQAGEQGVQFTLETAALKTHLQVLGESVAKRTTVPALSQVLVGVRDGSLTLATCDTRIYQSAILADVVEDITAQDAFLVDWARLTKFVNSVGSKEIDFAFDKKGKVTLRAGSVTAALGTLTVEQFPKPWRIKEVLFESEIDARETAAALKAAAVAASSDEARPVFVSVRWRVSHNMTMDATDGYRLHRAVTVTPDLPETDAAPLEMILPAESVGAIQQVLGRAGSTGTVHLTVAENSLRISTRLPSTPTSSDKMIYTVQTGLRNVQYPAVEAMIPKSACLIVAMEIEELLDALGVGRDFVSGGVNLMTICLRETPQGDFLTLTGHNETDQFAARLAVGVDWTRDNGAPLLASINVGLFIDGIRALQGTDPKAKRVQLFYNTGKLPLFLALEKENAGGDPLLDATAFAVIMPMHVPGGITFEMYTGDYAARDDEATWLAVADRGADQRQQESPAPALQYVPDEPEFSPEIEAELEIAF